VQLNARLAPEGARDREIFWIWADLVAALVPGYPPGGAREALGRLNGALRG
jgi:hypothetical protein